MDRNSIFICVFIKFVIVVLKICFHLSVSAVPATWHCTCCMIFTLCGVCAMFTSYNILWKTNSACAYVVKISCHCKREFCTLSH